MLDQKLLKIVSNKMPRMNKKLVEGLAVSQLNEVEQYINDVFRCAAESFPPGMKYVGGRRCTPMEQFREITRALKPTRNFEMLRSDVYLMKYTFTYQPPGGGPVVELRPQYIFLPFVSDGGLIHLKNTQYLITPVIGGKVFNIENGNIYMPTPRIRMGFSQHAVTCILNNKVIHSAAVVSRLHNMQKNERSSLYPTVIHYMLAEHGLYKLMLQYFNADIKFGKSELDKLDHEEWMVYRSRQLVSLSRRPTDISEISEIRIAVPKDQWYPLLNDVINTIFYIIDNCVEATSNVADLNNPLLWLLLLDRFIFKNETTEKKQYTRMYEHLLSTKMNMDPITKRILLNGGIECNSIFELFKYLVLNYQDTIIHYDVGTMFYKELTTTKHFLYHVVYNIFMTMHKLHEIPVELLSAAKINTVLMMVLSDNKIFTTMGHGELTPVSLATDCKIFGATCNVISHNKATSVGGSKRGKKVVNDPAQLLHESQCEVGTVNWITHQGPLGRDKLSPFVHFGERYFITPNPELQEDIEAMRQLLSKHK